MNPCIKISLLTLVGLILPFGNIWGPYLIKKPQSSSSYVFRKRLVIIESFCTLSAFVLSVILNVKAFNMGFNLSLMRLSAFVLVIYCLMIIITAMIAVILAQRIKNA